MADDQENTVVVEKDRFRNVKEVVTYLKGTGRNVSKSTVYNHRKWKWLRAEQNGEILLSEVKKYIKMYLDKDSDGPAASTVKTTEMQEAKAEKEKAQAKHWTIKTGILEEKYIEKTLYERDLANRAMLLKSDGDNFFRSSAQEMTEIVDGDPELVPDLIAFCIKKWESFLGRYAEEREFAVQKE
jgi:hypothetical protein